MKLKNDPLQIFNVCSKLFNLKCNYEQKSKKSATYYNIIKDVHLQNFAVHPLELSRLWNFVKRWSKPTEKNNLPKTIKFCIPFSNEYNSKQEINEYLEQPPIKNSFEEILSISHFNAYKTKIEEDYIICTFMQIKT